MSDKNLAVWGKVKTPPHEAIKKIKGGRLNGMSDISPMWRYMELTKLFGPCGVGWKYSISRTWTEQGCNDQVCAFAEIELFIKYDGSWSEAIPGLGGSMLTAKEKAGLYTSDECYKMAITDAISVACKVLGFGADIHWSEGGKFINSPQEEITTISNAQFETIDTLIATKGADVQQFCTYFKVDKIDNLPADKFETARKMLESK